MFVVLPFCPCLILIISKVACRLPVSRILIYVALFKFYRVSLSNSLSKSANVAPGIFFCYYILLQVLARGNPLHKLTDLQFNRVRSSALPELKGNLFLSSIRLKSNSSWHLCPVKLAKVSSKFTKFFNTVLKDFPLVSIRVFPVLLIQH